MAERRKIRLLSIGHSYCVTLNRGLLNQIATIAGDRWDITVVAPISFPGDLGRIELARDRAELVAVRGVPVHFPSRIHMMLYGWEVKRILAEPWDLVHCWEEPFVISAAQIAGWTRRSTPFVFNTYQNLSKRYPPPFRWSERYCLHRSAGWLTGAQSVEQTLLGRGYGSRPHRVIPFSVDQKLFSPQARWKRDTLGELRWAEGDPPVVGYLGRFTEAKGIGIVMNALDGVRAPWRALFVGGGEWEGRIQDWATRYPDRVRVVKAVPHHRVPEYLNAMDLLCAPSQTMPNWREQFGRMVIEAFACGVPVVASDSGEIPHVAGEAAMVLKEDDRGAWTAAIDHLLAEPAARAQLSRKGLERVRQNYTLEHVAREHMAFFEEMLSTKTR